MVLTGDELAKCLLSATFCSCAQVQTTLRRIKKVMRCVLHAL